MRLDLSYCPPAWDYEYMHEYGTVPAQAPSWLTSRDLNGVLQVLEDCERASSLHELRYATLEGIARYLGYRNVTFFVGRTPELCFSDRSAVILGRVERMLEPYLERYRPDDPFSRPPAIQLMLQSGVVSLDQLPALTRPNLRDYLDNFLFRGGMHSKMAILAHSSEQLTAAIGVLDEESGAFGQRDLAIARILGRHLGNLAARHVDPAPKKSLMSGLSVRQAEVVALVSQGLTNLEVACTLHISVDTVKKHLTSALRITGCQNRTQLALAWRADAAAGIQRSR